MIKLFTKDGLWYVETISKEILFKDYLASLLNKGLPSIKYVVGTGVFTQLFTVLFEADDPKHNLADYKSPFEVLISPQGSILIQKIKDQPLAKKLQTSLMADGHKIVILEVPKETIHKVIKALKK
jgi:hypothetical protein